MAVPTNKPSGLRSTRNEDGDSCTGAKGVMISVTVKKIGFEKLMKNKERYRKTVKAKKAGRYY
jgi:hypothetical protein